MAEAAHFMDPEAWNRIIAKLPGAHVLQSSQWGAIKSRHGWQVVYCLWIEQGTDLRLIHNLPKDNVKIWAAALVLHRVVTFRGLAIPFNFLYTPKGPLVADWQNREVVSKVLDDLVEFAQHERAILIKMDPDVRLGVGVPGTEGDQEDQIGLGIQELLKQTGWVVSNEQVQFRNTILIDLSQSEETLLARMKQKTRYNIRLATRKGVEIRIGDISDLAELYSMYAKTALRDGFVLREPDYYLDVWTTFLNSGMATPMIAFVDGAPVAAVIIFHFAGKAWYLYGMSRVEHRDKMPNHLLQWEAILRAKAEGCAIYDFWGAPDQFIETDSMWGVYRFKEGYGGEVTRYIGAWDFPVNKPFYKLYTQLLPKLLNLMRQKGARRLQQSVS